MKKLMLLLVALALVATACSTDSEISADMSMEEMGTELTQLGAEAQLLIDDVNTADAGAEISNVLQVLADNTSTVALSATGGEVSNEDLDRLVGTLGDFDTEIDAVRDSLDADLVDRLESFRDEVQSVVDNMTG